MKFAVRDSNGSLKPWIAFGSMVTLLALAVGCEARRTGVPITGRHEMYQKSNTSGCVAELKLAESEQRY